MYTPRTDTTYTSYITTATTPRILTILILETRCFRLITYHRVPVSKSRCPRLPDDIHLQEMRDTFYSPRIKARLPQRDGAGNMPRLQESASNSRSSQSMPLGYSRVVKVLQLTPLADILRHPNHDRRHTQREGSTCQTRNLRRRRRHRILGCWRRNNATLIIN